MLVVEKVDSYMIHFFNTETKTPFELPTNFLALDIELEPGDVIKVVKDELKTRRVEKEQFEEAEKDGIAHLFKWKFKHKK